MEVSQSMSEGSDFFDDSSKLTYPQADRLVADYIEERGSMKARVTSRDVLNWSEAPDTVHNKRRVHDALSRPCEPTDANWAGRTVFELPADTQQP